MPLDNTGLDPRYGREQVTSVDQSDRIVPYNLRQSGPTPTELLISTRVRKSPYWHLSHEAGCWRATVYNRVYHPRGYVRPEDGGAAVEHEALTRHVTMWNVAVERQIRVRGPDAERFVNRVITRDATRIRPMHGKYVILCNEKGGILNDPVLLRLAEDEFWFSLSDSDLMFWLQGVNVGLGMQVEIDEIDACPVQIQGPKSAALMADLVGPAIHDMAFYGVMEARIGGAPVIVSQSGFSGEKGFEIYLRDATLHANAMWQAVLDAGKAHNLMVIAPGHQRRIAAGILSWGQDLDHETNPFQCNLGYQVPRRKQADYIGKAALERMRAELEAGRPSWRQQLVGMRLGGRPIDDYAPDFWLVSEPGGGEPIGYLTSPWHAPELGCNIAMGYVPVEKSGVGTELAVWLPDRYADEPGRPVAAEICEMPFRPSANPNAREIAKAEGRDTAF